MSTDGAGGELTAGVSGERARLPSTDAPPVWSVGDYWVYRDGTGNRNTFVVSDVNATDYLIDTDSDSFAFFDAMDDISTVGPQRKVDLAGSQGSDRIEFFRFPLTDGATWTTTWDGAPRTIVATDLGGNVFGFESTGQDGTPHARYTYDAAAGWFGALEFLGDDGSTLFTNQLVESGRGFTGDLIRYVVDQVYARDDTGSDLPVHAGLSTAPFTQEESHTDVFLIYSASCALGHLLFTVVPEEPTPDTQGHSANAPCPKTEAFFGSLGSHPGEWGIALIKAADADASVSAQVFLRTQTILTIP